MTDGVKIKSNNVNQTSPPRPEQECTINTVRCHKEVLAPRAGGINGEYAHALSLHSHASAPYERTAHAHVAAEYVASPSLPGGVAAHGEVKLQCTKPRVERERERERK